MKNIFNFIVGLFVLIILYPIAVLLELLAGDGQPGDVFHLTCVFMRGWYRTFIKLN